MINSASNCPELPLASILQARAKLLELDEYRQLANGLSAARGLPSCSLYGPLGETYLRNTATVAAAYSSLAEKTIAEHWLEQSLQYLTKNGK